MNNSIFISNLRSHWKSLALFATLEASAVLLWLPSILWPFTISWDENTFFLVAQRLLHGELPYTTTFENKSPLGLVFQSFAMAVVGANPVALRLVAALIMGVTAFLLVSSRPTERRFMTSYLVGFLFLFTWVNLTNGLVWMSEVNVVLIFAIAWWLIFRGRKQSFRLLLFTGIVIGTLPLVRINWGFVAVVLFVAVWIPNKTFRGWLLLFFASFIPTTLVLITFLLSGSITNMWAGMIALPRGLGEGEGWIFPTPTNDQLPLYWLGILFIITAFQLVSLRWYWLREHAVKTVDVALLAAAWALTVGAWIQPYDFPYQTLQLLPMFALSIGRIVQLMNGYESIAVIPIAMACVSLSYLYWNNVITVFDWRNSSRHESEVVTFLSELPGIEEKTLWVPDSNNYLYWRLGKKPVIPLASQPYLVWERGAQKANLGFEMSEGEASQYVFDQRPTLIVAASDYNGSYNQTQEAGEVWRDNIESNYIPLSIINGRTVWQRVSQ